MKKSQIKLHLFLAPIKYLLKHAALLSKVIRSQVGYPIRYFLTFYHSWPQILAVAITKFCRPNTNLCFQHLCGIIYSLHKKE